MSTTRRFLNENDGHAFTFFVVSLPAFIGVSLLAIDVGRGHNLHYDLQKAVDSLAIAAAAELDGGPTAIERARAAMTGMLENGSRFSNEGAVARYGLSPDNVTVEFLCDLPLSDDTPINTAPCSVGGSGNITTDPTDARFAWVRAWGPHAESYTTIFPITMFSGSDTVRVGAEAVAGGTQGASGSKCGLAPVFICDPFEHTTPDDDPTTFDSLHDLANPGSPFYGRLITFRAQGGNQAQHGPGNWGWLVTTGPGADALRDGIAMEDNGYCVENGEVTTQPGFVNNAAWGANVRFDMFSGDLMGAARSDENFRPARNVRAGYQGGNGANSACGGSEGSVEDGFSGLTPDQNLDSSPGEIVDAGGGEIGKGDWDFETYWAVNYGHPGAGGPNGGAYPVPNGWSNANPPSRYELYRYELTWSNGELLNVPSIGGETGVPDCYQGPVDSITDEPDRRLLNIAIISCDREEAKGRDTMAVSYYGELFLTQPIEHTGNTDRTLQGELVGVTGVDGDGQFGVSGLNPEVLLYR